MFARSSFLLGLVFAAVVARAGVREIHAVTDTPVAQVLFGLRLTDGSGMIAQLNDSVEPGDGTYRIDAGLLFPDDFAFGTGDACTLLGTYGDEGVFVSVAEDVSGRAFEDVFGTPEADLRASIDKMFSEDGTTAFEGYLEIQGFIAGHTGLFAAEAQTTLYQFSDARAAGTLTIQAVPEPASLAGLGLGTLALMRRRRS